MAASESFGASMVKVGMMVTGATAASAPSLAEIIGTYGQQIIWCVTIIYGSLQIVKAIPWFTDQAYAFWRGVRHGDWSRWWAIARRGEQVKDDKGE